MKENMNLIVMLTHNDKTVENAYYMFDKYCDTQAEFWGFKEEPLLLEEMKKIYAYMKAKGKKTFLEVVAYSEEEGIRGAEIALECGCDILMGTIFHDSINNFCKENNLKYMPFVGKITERPSILEGKIEDIVTEAKNYISKGAYGIDLLGYRYTGDAVKLNEELVKNIKAPVCIAGSVNSYQRLEELKSISPWAFTIGGAFFENKFGTDFGEQINAVCEYVKNNC